MLEEKYIIFITSTHHTCLNYDPKKGVLKKH